MEAEKFSKRNAKKIKFIIEERPEHNKCKELKKLRKLSKANRKDSVRVKDWVKTHEENDENIITFQKVRKTEKKPDTTVTSSVERKVFSRPSPHLGTNREKGIAANIDRIVIVTSIKNPPMKKGLIDRFIVIGEKKEFDLLICVNKIDLQEDMNSLYKEMEVYTSLGYKVIYTSTKLNRGMDELNSFLKKGSSLFIGHSGVGKSSLINALEPSISLRVGDISSSNNKGTHTTTSTKLIKLRSGGEIFDCPGIKQFGLMDIKKEEVSSLFREFRENAKMCRFPDCSHITEEYCGVKEAVLSGHISKERYESFVRIFSSL